MPLYGDAKRAYDVAWRKARRDEWIESQGGKCVDCGSSNKLEVDHINPTTKSTNPTNLWSRRKEIRDAELVKCTVRCYDCHEKKTTSEQSIDHPHGTYSRYSKGCRCNKCKEFVKLWWRDYRQCKNTSMV